MLLTKIILDNIGVYKNSNEFDLETTPQKPIILYGGVNGAGKTTLFESIPLCLYGQRYAENKITKKKNPLQIWASFGLSCAEVGIPQSLLGNIFCC